MNFQGSVIVETIDIIEQQIIPEKKAVAFVEKPVYDFLKRAFDIFFSLAVLIFLCPVLIISAIAIMIDDFGNPFFVQERSGKNNKTFKMIKFRTMYKDAEKRRNELLADNEANGPIFKIADDPRVIRIGKFMRAFSIDEIPQFINVLIGNMSVVGPRPLPTYEQAACNEYQQKRLIIKPGITCYNALDKESQKDFNSWIELDMKYIRDRSFLTDIKIIFKTVVVVLSHKNY